MKSLWTLSGLTWRQFAFCLWENDGEVFPRAAQLSYYFLLALVPMLLFLTSIIGFVMGAHSGLMPSLFNYLRQVMPPAAFDLIRITMLDIRKGTSGGTLSFGLLAALWAASSGVDAITGSLNAAYNVRETRPWWKTRSLALALTVGLAILIVTALLLVLCGGKIANAIAETWSVGPWFIILWHIVQWPLVVGFILLAFALVYFFAPNLRGRKWALLTPGSVIGTTLWLLISYIFRVYLHYFDTYSKTYGSLGAVIVLMLWLYLTGIAILLGGRINSEIESAVARSLRPRSELFRG